MVSDSVIGAGIFCWDGLEIVLLAKGWMLVGLTNHYKKRFEWLRLNCTLRVYDLKEIL